ncbi:MAG: hypothetical protein KC434_20710, partial [Anaerolineales bacterium]|nr:hypothetical protein [Anaerolineales bacterium]
MTVLRTLALPVLLILLAACGPTPADEATPTAVATPIAVETNQENIITEQEPTPGTNEESESLPANDSPIDDEEARALMFNLSEGSNSEADAALERILATNDQRYVS